MKFTATRFTLSAMLVVLAGCATQTPPPPAPAVPVEVAPALPVSSKFAPPPAGASEVTVAPPAERCDFSVTLGADRAFAAGQSRLRPGMRLELDSVVMRVQSCARLELVTVTGHSDRTGGHQANQTLSEKRAEAVKAYLVGRGLASEKIIAVGAGETQSMAEGCSAKLAAAQLTACLAPDRRVVIEARGLLK